MPLGFGKKLLFWTAHVEARRPRRHSSHLWLRRKIAAVILLVLLLGSSSYFWYFTTDKRIQQQTTQVLQQILGGEIVIEHASLEVMRQIRIRELAVYLPGQEHTEKNLVFTAQDVILRHKPWSILSRRLRVEEIIAYQPYLYIWYDHDENQFNLQLLQRVQGEAIPTFTPHITLEQGSVSFSEFVKGKKVRQSIQDLRGRIGAKDPETGTIKFSFLHCIGEDRNIPFLSGTYNPQTKELTSHGEFSLRDMIQFTHLPERIKEWKEQYELSEFDGEVTIDTHYDANMGLIVQFHLTDGQLNLPVPLKGADIPLQDVQADIVFTNDRIRIDSIHGRYQRFCEFSAQGMIEDYSTDAAFTLSFETKGLQIPDTQWARLPNTDNDLPAYDSEEFLSRLGPPLDSLFSMAPPDIRKQIHTYSPTGAMDLQVQMQRSAEGKIESYGGKISCNKIRLKYQQFPYQLEEVQGDILIEPGLVKVGPLVSHREDHRIEINGLWKHQDDESTFEIKIDSQNSPLDQNLYGALKPWQQRLWDDFRPTGQAHCKYQASFEKTRKIQEKLHIQIDNVDVCFRPFPVPVTDIYGTIDSDGTQIHIEVDRAQVRSGNIEEMTCDVTQMQEAEPQIQCQLKFRDVWLDDTFRKSLPSAFKQFYKQIALQGRAEGSASLSRFPIRHYRESPAQREGKDRPFELMDYEISAKLKEGQIRFAQLPYTLSEVHAQVKLTKEKLKIESLQGKHGKSNLFLSGELQDPNHYELHIEGKPLELSPELAQALGKDPNRIWEELNPSGLVNLTMDLKRPSMAEIPATREPFIVIQPINCEIKPKAFPYPFPIDAGAIEVFPEKFVLMNLTSTRRDPNVVLSGVIPRTDAESNCHLDIKAESVPLDDQFGRALPEKLAGLYNRLDPSGTFNLKLTADRPMHSPEPADWEFAGHVTLTKGGVRWPTQIEDMVARLVINQEKNGKAGYNPKTKDFYIENGEFTAPSLLLKQREVQDVRGVVQYQGDLKQLALTEMSGELCRGQMAGEMMFQVLAEPGEYELKLQFTDTQLDSLLKVSSSLQPKWKNLRGAMTGWLNVRQTGDPDDRRGTFLFIIRDAVLGELPIAAQILHVLNLSLPQEGAFNEASFAGDIIGEKVRFDPIHLRGSAVALTGAGIMTQPDRKLELVFMVDSPHKLPKIPVITSFLNAFKGEVAQVWVTGTFEEPDVQPVAFPSLEEALRQLSTDLPPPTPKHRPTMR